MLTAIIVFLLCLVLILSYLLYITFRKLSHVEAYCEAYIQFVSTLYIRFYQTRNHMKEVDLRGSFQSDDEVGVVFRELNSSVEELYEFITKYINAEAEKGEKTKN